MLNFPVSRERAWALAFCAAILAIPLAQLAPLPPSVWMALPGREALASTFELMGRAPAWLPLSLSPRATWLSLLSLLPALAVFVCVIQLDYSERRLLSLVTIVMGFFSVLVGLTQVAQGPTSALRFFSVTNTEDAVGFFANRNHFAALLYTLTLLAAAWAGNNGIAFGREKNRGRFSTGAIVSQLASFSILAVLIGAQVITRSRAGMVLTVGALVGAVLLVQLGQRAATTGLRPIWLMAGSAALAILLSIQYGLYRALDRFAMEAGADARVTFARNTIAAAKVYMPFGAGTGSFVPVYAMFEKPRDLLIEGYANHAHDDFLEIWLETGVVGVALIGLFLIWLVQRMARVWRRSYSGGLDIDRFLVRGATLAIVLLLLHSAVDYPLRTGAMMTIFAFLVALLIPPVSTRVQPGFEHAAATRAPSPRNRPRAGLETASAPPSREHPASSKLSQTLTSKVPASPGSPSVTSPAPSTPARPKPASPIDELNWPEEWQKSRVATPRRPDAGKPQEPSRKE